MTSGIHFFLPEFQSTLPLRGATFQSYDYVSQDGISIHTPLAGSDSNYSQKTFLIFGTIDKYLYSIIS